MWKRVLAILACIILVAIGLTIRFGAQAGTRLVAQMLDRQDVVTGTLKYDKIDASWSGDVQIHNLRWIGLNGSKKAEVPLVTLSINLWETLTKGGGVASVNALVLDRPHFFGIYSAEKGLDILHGLQFAGGETQGVYKPAKPVEPTDFRGEVEIKDGIFDLLAGQKLVQFQKINGQGLFKQYPLLQFNLTAVNGSSNMVFNIVKNGTQTKVKGEVKNGLVADFVPFLPYMKDVNINGGKVDTANIDALKEEGNRWQLHLSGQAKEMTGTAFGWDFTGGQGKFTAGWDEIAVEQFACKVSEMPVTISGVIKTAADSPDPASYDLKFSAPEFALEGLSEGLEFDNKLSVLGTITGSVLEPKFTGTVTTDSLQAGPLAIKGLAGNFKLEHGSLLFTDFKGDASGGIVHLAGSLTLPGKDFLLSAEGNDLVLAGLTAENIGGKVHFIGTFTGKNKVNSAQGNGSFIVNDGMFGADKISNFKGNYSVENGTLKFADTTFKKGFKEFTLKLEQNKDKKVVILSKDGKIKLF
jgi:hypothetical protein